MLVSDKDERKVPALVDRARRTWIKAFGKARTADRVPRSDIGVAKPSAGRGDKPSMAEWIRKRRAAVSQVAEKWKALGSVAQICATWSCNLRARVFSLAFQARRSSFLLQRAGLLFPT
eukprot:15437220-Alexandrium_andersonii.AAC.1